jgi:hypothetical protein
VYALNPSSRKICLLYAIVDDIFRALRHVDPS